MHLRLTEMSSRSTHRKLARVIATALFVMPALVVYTLADAAPPPLAPVAPGKRAPAPTVAPIIPRIDAGSTGVTPCTITLSGNAAAPAPFKCVPIVQYDGTTALVGISGVSSDPANPSQFTFLAALPGEPVVEQRYVQPLSNTQSATFISGIPQSHPVWVTSQGVAGTPNQGTSSFIFSHVNVAMQTASVKVYETHGRVDIVLAPQTSTGAAGQMTATIAF